MDGNVRFRCILADEAHRVSAPLTLLTRVGKEAVHGRLLFPSNSVIKHYYNGIAVQGGADIAHDQTIF